uniref:Predicted protein n=1 Tax=Hordeum vulgare subsp. vulgare TaxID=112509 RepID=F2EG56_HORVV|nr:predicted protein [Hordeum vulgare subsp. vulgare]
MSFPRRTQDRPWPPRVRQEEDALTRVDPLKLSASWAARVESARLTHSGSSYGTLRPQGKYERHRHGDYRLGDAKEYEHRRHEDRRLPQHWKQQPRRCSTSCRSSRSPTCIDCMSDEPVVPSADCWRVVEDEVDGSANRGHE